MYEFENMVHYDGYSLEETEEGTRLFVNGSWTPTIEDLVESGRISQLVLNSAHGFNEPNLDFLRQWPISRLDVLTRHITDLGPISRLRHVLGGLSVMAVHPSSDGTLDLDGFESLRKLSVPWSLVRNQTHAMAQVTDLFFLNYQGIDLAPLAGSTFLTALRMKHYPQIRSLNGLEEFDQLHVLSIHGAAKLIDLSALRDSGTAQNLIELQLETCQRITVLDDVASATGVQFLNLGNCGDIASLKPLSDMSELRRLYLYESTKILDGDLTPLLALRRIEELRMADRRSYRPSVAEIRKQLGIAE
jgi:hypothetical protein